MSTGPVSDLPGPVPVQIVPYHRGPEAIRDVHRLVTLLKKERTQEGLYPTDERILDQVQSRVSEMTSLEVIDLLMNNGPLFARVLNR